MNMRRRGFLQSSLVAGAGVALAQNVMGDAKSVSSAEQLNVAMIGFGDEGRVLLDSCLKIPNLSLKAVCDIWDYKKIYGQRYMMKYGHKPNAYTDYQDMLENEEDLDAVIVATPDFMHAEHTNACLEQGINVYCEKMMSNDIEEARSMVRTMKETGKLLQIGHQRRSNPCYLHALKLINRAHILGRITNVNGQWNRGVSKDLGWAKAYTIPPETLKKYGYENMHQFRNWRWFKKYGGGPISDLGAHQIDIYNWFLGTTPRTVMASGGVDYYKDHEWEDNVMAIYEYDTPAGVVRAFYQVLTTTRAGGGYFEYFMGDEGCLKISENQNIIKAYREPSAPEWDKWVKANYVRKDTSIKPIAPNAGQIDVRASLPPDEYDLPVSFNKPLHMPHLENFFAAIKGKKELNCPADHAFESEVAVFKVNEAIPARKVLEFTESDFAV